MSANDIVWSVSPRYSVHACYRLALHSGGIFFWSNIGFFTLKENFLESKGSLDFRLMGQTDTKSSVLQAMQLLRLCGHSACSDVATRPAREVGTARTFFSVMYLDLGQVVSRHDTQMQWSMRFVECTFPFWVVIGPPTHCDRLRITRLIRIVTVSVHSGRWQATAFWRLASQLTVTKVTWGSCDS